MLIMTPSQITLGDIIVWWRVCVLWRKRAIIALALALTVGTFSTFICQALRQWT